jgi:drug/metabolite transporter (DMT)-like permease
LLLVLLATACFSVAPTLIKLGLVAEAEPVTLIAVRLVAATAGLWLTFSIARPRVLRIDRRGLAFCGLVAIADSLGMVSFYHAMTRIDASVGQMVFSLYPLAALLLLAVRGERIGWRSWVRLALGLSGVYLLIGFGGRVDILGVLLVVVSAVSYALQLTLTQWYLGDYPSETVALYVISLMALVMSAVRLLQLRPWQPLSPIGWGVVLLTALVPTFAARLALFAGIRRVGSGQASLFGPLEMLLSVTWTSLFLGERLSPAQWSGGLLILASVLLAGLRGRPAAVTVSVDPMADFKGGS